jgi:hypothetical protein
LTDLDSVSGALVLTTLLRFPPSKRLGMIRETPVAVSALHREEFCHDVGDPRGHVGRRPDVDGGELAGREVSVLGETAVSANVVGLLQVVCGDDARVGLMAGAGEPATFGL